MKNEEAYRDVLRALELVALQLELLKAAPEETIPLVARAREMARRLEFWMERGDRRYVYWIERRGRGTFLQATPIDVSQMLDEKLVRRGRYRGADFGHAGRRRRVSISRKSAWACATPARWWFPAISITPSRRCCTFRKTCPIRAAPRLPPRPRDEIVELLTLSRGRAFVLFTSYQQMRLIYDRVSLEVPYQTLMQGTGPRSALLEEFRSTPNAVLFATSSFWQGVDVPGEQLSCVIIDKLPFAVPSDPVVEARIAAIKNEGGDAFHGYQVPQAAIALKQGFGRLIRSRTRPRGAGAAG